MTDPTTAAKAMAIALLKIEERRVEALEEEQESEDLGTDAPSGPDPDGVGDQ
jgi:hypothetical protein